MDQPRLTEKSYVTLEQNVCPVCASSFDTGNLLLDRRLKPTFEHKTVTGWNLCPTCKARFDEGYVALVEIDAERTDFPATPNNAYRLGRIAHVRRRLAESFCPDLEATTALAWVDTESMNYLEETAKRAAEGWDGEK